MTATLEELIKELEVCAIVGTNGNPTWKRNKVRQVVAQIVELVRNGEDDDGTVRVDGT